MCKKGVLADEMGLGKTIQTVALLAHLACEEGVWGPHLVVVLTRCVCVGGGGSRGCLGGSCGVLGLRSAGFEPFMGGGGQT
jgi:hypothetical protein